MYTAEPIKYVNGAFKVQEKGRKKIHLSPDWRNTLTVNETDVYI